MKNLIYLMDRILYQIFKIIVNISLKKHKEKASNPSITIFVNKIENRIAFKIKIQTLNYRNNEITWKYRKKDK